MKTIIRNLTTLILLPALIQGCSKDDGPGYATGLVDEAADLTGQLNVVYIDVNKPAPMIRLFAEEPVYSVTTDPLNGIIVAIERIDGLQYLRFFPPVPEEPAEGEEAATVVNYPFACEFKISVTSDESLTKNLYAVFHDPGKVGEGAGETGDVISAIGCGMDITGDLGGNNRKKRLLSYTAIFDNLSLARRDLITDNDINTRDTAEIITLDYRVATEKLMSHMGVAGFAGLHIEEGPKYAFASAMDAVLGSKATESDYQYYVNYLLLNRRQASLTNKIKGSTTTLIAFTDSTACRTLNNPQDEGYKAYPNNQEGIFRLLDDYGTHIMTQATFGGRHMYVYGRKNAEYPYGAEVSASTHLSSLFTGTQPGTYTTFAGAKGMKDSLALYSPTPAVEATTEPIYAAAALGGNGNPANIDSWINSVTGETSVLIGYGGATDATRGGLLEITHIVIDPERQLALAEHLGAYLKSRFTPKKGDTQ